jgi:hypothetical protein
MSSVSVPVPADGLGVVQVFTSEPDPLAATLVAQQACDLVTQLRVQGQPMDKRE